MLNKTQYMQYHIVFKQNTVIRQVLGSDFTITLKYWKRKNLLIWLPLPSKAGTSTYSLSNYYNLQFEGQYGIFGSYTFHHPQ